MYQDNIFRLKARSEGRDDFVVPIPFADGEDVARRAGVRLKTPPQEPEERNLPVFRSVRSARDTAQVPLTPPPPATETAPATTDPSPCEAADTSDETWEPGPISTSGGISEIYTGHFNLTERPFTLLPDPEFIYWSEDHRSAFTMLEYGTITGAPITLITGEVGAGKTTLLQKFLRNMEGDVTIGLISNCQGSRGELLRWALMALDQTAEPDATYVDLFEAFQDFLITEYAAGRKVILIIDEAQNLSTDTLEELRMFTNINSNKDELLQLVLVGQPELSDKINRPELRQFAQRVAARYHLNVLNEVQATKYIAHRLQIAGAESNCFSKNACKRIHEKTRGVPRLVNQLCDLSMVYAFSKAQEMVTVETVDEVLADGTFFYASGFPDETRA